MWDRVARRTEIYLNAKLRGIEPTMEEIERQLDREEQQVEQEREEIDRIYGEALEEARAELRTKYAKLEQLEKELSSKQIQSMENLDEREKIISRQIKNLNQYQRDLEKSIEEKVNARYQEFASKLKESLRVTLYSEWMDSLDEEVIFRIIRYKYQYDKNWVRKLEYMTREALEFWTNRKGK